MRIALAANGRMGLGLLRALQASEHQVVALVRDGRSSRGPMRWVDTVGSALGGPWSVEGRAVAGRLPFIWLDQQDPRECARLAAVEPDLLLVGNFGLILRRPVLKVPRIGTVNTHWSLLPAHRGPHPATSVLLSGDPRTGVTFHVVDERIDAGPILDQADFPVDADDTATTLYQKAAAEAERRIVDLVDRIAVDGLVGEAQDLSQGSYHKRLTPSQAVLDFSESADALDRKVRALVSPLPRFRHRGTWVYVTHARAVPGDGSAPGTILATRPHLTIACGLGALTLDAAWTAMPPAPWPAPWTRVRRGDVLETQG